MCVFHPGCWCSAAVTISLLLFYYFALLHGSLLEIKNSQRCLLHVYSTTLFMTDLPCWMTDAFEDWRYVDFLILWDFSGDVKSQGIRPVKSGQRWAIWSTTERKLETNHVYNKWLWTHHSRQSVQINLTLFNKNRLVYRFVFPLDNINQSQNPFNPRAHLAELLDQITFQRFAKSFMGVSCLLCCTRPSQYDTRLSRVDKLQTCLINITGFTYTNP